MERAACTQAMEIVSTSKQCGPQESLCICLDTRFPKFQRKNSNKKIFVFLSVDIKPQTII